METSARIAREIRASRIHQLWKRGNAHFRDAAFAARLANDQLQLIEPKHPNWAALSNIQNRAITQLDRWNKRCQRLARAEIATLLRPVEALDAE